MTRSPIFRSIPEQIAVRLRQDILGGVFAPGQPLREQEIAEQFGVSRGPIPEAFRQLTEQGLLVLEPNKGVRVAPLPSLKVRPLIAEVRRTIELFALEAIFERITPTDIARWDGILADMRRACEQGDTAALVECDLHFHSALIQSHDETVTLLPALPAAWKDGQVTGLRARGNFFVDIKWKDGKVTDYRISSPQATEAKAKINGEVKTVKSSVQ